MKTTAKLLFPLLFLFTLGMVGQTTKPTVPSPKQPAVTDHDIPCDTLHDGNYSCPVNSPLGLLPRSVTPKPAEKPIQTLPNCPVNAPNCVITAAAIAIQSSGFFVVNSASDGAPIMQCGSKDGKPIDCILTDGHTWDEVVAAMFQSMKGEDDRNSAETKMLRDELRMAENQLARDQKTFKELRNDLTEIHNILSRPVGVPSGRCVRVVQPKP